MKTAEVCRKHGISSATLYAWKAKYGGMDVSQARKLKVLEEENARLKRLLADAMLDTAVLKEVAAKNWCGPPLSGSLSSMLGSSSASASVGPFRSSAWTGPRCATPPGAALIESCSPRSGPPRPPPARAAPP